MTDELDFCDIHLSNTATVTVAGSVWDIWNARIEALNRGDDMIELERVIAFPSYETVAFVVVPGSIEAIAALSAERLAQHRNQAQPSEQPTPPETCGATTPVWNEIGEDAEVVACTLLAGHDGDHSNGVVDWAQVE